MTEGSGESSLKRLVPLPTSPAGKLVELIAIVLIALGLAFTIQAWAVKPYQIPSGSMEPTLDVGQRVLANRFIYHFEDPGIGDIIVFHPPVPANHESPGLGPSGQCGVDFSSREPCPKAATEEADNNFIKRIVAGPGDTLRIHNGHPVVNGVEKTDEPYINPCGTGGACNLPKTITIPPGHYFMMGDNRGASDDSRFWGPIPRDWIIGKAFATYWPLDRVGIL
jgi:signal peptidase I